jgi:hypothetical protein
MVASRLDQIVRFNYARRLTRLSHVMKVEKRTYVTKKVSISSIAFSAHGISYQYKSED